MIKKKEFYITLPSNTIVPNSKHTPSNFNIPLPETIEFPHHQQWKVGLAEIFLPNYTRNITKENNVFYIYYNGNDGRFFRKLKISSGNYTPETFVSEINNVIARQTYPARNEEGKHLGYDKRCMPSCTFSYNENSGFITVALNGQEKIAITNKNLRSMLGMEEEFISPPIFFLDTHPKPPENFDITKVQYTKLPHQANFDNQGNYFHIETNIIKKLQVGNVFAPLLKIITPKEKQYRDLIHRKFENPTYQELKNNIIKNIEIQIKNEKGEIIKFYSGNSTVVLHFKCF